MYTLGERFNREEFYGEFGEGSTFPQVTCNGQKLGGCVDTIKYLQEHKIAVLQQGNQSFLLHQRPAFLNKLSRLPAVINLIFQIFFY